MNLEALYALYPPLRINSELYIGEFERFIEHFKVERTVHVRGSTAHDGEPLFVRAEQCEPAQHKQFFSGAPFFGPGAWLLRFHGSFNFPGEHRYYFTDQAGKRLNYSTEELISAWQSSLPGNLDVTIQTYLCSLTIAFSGTVRVTRNAWLLDSKQTNFTSTYVSEIDAAVEYLSENGIVPLTKLDASKVIKWVFSQNGMFDGYSNNPAARALNYFTRLFERQFRSDELGDLVWALAGIEALLVEGGRSSVGQLKEKLVSLFATNDNSTWLRSMCDQLYGYRSRMVHGDRQIRSAFRTDDPEVDGRFHEEYDSELFAIGILFILLQRVIDRNITKFQFRTIEVNEGIS